jgi:hypothetical protein
MNRSPQKHRGTETNQTRRPSVSSAASVRSEFDLFAPQLLTHKIFRFSLCLCASVVNQEPLQ